MNKAKNRFKIGLFLLFAMFLQTIGSFDAQAQNRSLVVIRDTEIENIIEEWSKPVFEAAGLNPKSVNIILVQSSDLNAFVAGGSNIFIYTGLIEKTDNPGELIGVIAHEVGHITGGHLIRTRDALERASYESIIGTILGIGAAIATGETGAVPALSLGSNSFAQRRFLAHSRVQESSADQAALSYMEKARLDPTGLSTFLAKLESEILAPLDQQSEYILTHPLVENRIEALKRRIEESPNAGKGFPEKWDREHALMKAKLLGFINPGQVLWVYDDRDQSIPAQYARAIAAYRNNQVDASISLMDRLIEEEPENPYFKELKGQALVDYGQLQEALPYYEQAVTMLPSSGLLRIALSHAMIETANQNENPDSTLNQAIEHLERALKDEPRSSRAHRLLATAYGRLGDKDMAKVHLAEEAVLGRNYKYAKEQANFVLKNAQEDSRAWKKAQDVLTYIQTHEKG